MGSMQQKCDSSVSNTTETMKEDIMIVLLLPILCGVYSFLHWFILVPLLWTAFAHGNWNATSFLVYEIVAFAIWVAVILLLLNMKCCKKKEPQRPPLKNCKDNSSNLTPHFQTRTAHVQPKDENLFHEPHLNQSGCNNGDRQVSISLYSIPVQPQCIPSASSKENMHKTADLFSESPPDPSDKKPQTNVLPVKENIKPYLRHSCSLGTERPGENLEPKDNVYHSKDNATSLKDTVMPDNFSENHEKHSHLSREESFVGLPEMNSFGSYLQLVTVDTPFSPSEQFFPDSVKRPDSDQTAQLNQSKEANTPESKVIQIDSPALEKGDTRSKLKDTPDDQHCGGGGAGGAGAGGGGGGGSGGGGSGGGGSNTSGGSSSSNSSSSSSSESGKGGKGVKTGKINSENLTKGDDDDEVFTAGAPVPHSKPKESLGECFIADVRKTESLTSEVFIAVNEPSHHRNTGDIIHVNLPSDALQRDVMNETNGCEEGRWAVLK